MDLELRSVIDFIYVGFLTLGRGIQILLDLFSNEELSSHLSFLGYGPMEDLVKS